MIDIQQLPLIPWPHTIQYDGGTVALGTGIIVDEFTSRSHSSHTSDASAKSRCVILLMQEIVKTIRTATGLRWHTAVRSHMLDFPHESTIVLAYNPALAPRSTRVNVSRETRVEASDLEGLRSGVQTLRQLIQACGCVLPQVHIADHPDYAQRGYLLDTTRGRVPRLTWLQHWADELELHKYTNLELYIEDSFAFTGMKSVWAGTDPLTADEIISFDQYCADRGIELIPCVATFGHLYSILRAEPFRQLGEFPEDADRPFSFIERQEHHTLNITADGAFHLSQRLIDDILPLFRSRKFNICGDETFDLGKGRSASYAHTVGIQQMYADYVNRLCRYVREKDHKPLMWGDIVLQHPEIVSQLTEHPLFLNWQYSPDVTEQTVQQLTQAGARQWVCAATHAWNSLLPSCSRAWSNISRLAHAGINNGAEGFVVTDWGDFGHINDPRMSEPALLMGAECAWNARKETDHEQLLARIDRTLFHSHSAVLTEIERITSSQSDFTWANAVYFTELEGKRGQLNDDVARSISGVAPAFREIAQASSVQEAQNLYLLALQTVTSARHVYAHNSCRETMEQAVAEGQLDHNMAHALLVAAWGQDLLNDYFRLLVHSPHSQDGKLQKSQSEVTALVAQMNRWYEEYRSVWLTSSRPSQLFRIHDVIRMLIKIAMQ